MLSEMDQDNSVGVESFGAAESFGPNNDHLPELCVCSSLNLSCVALGERDKALCRLNSSSLLKEVEEVLYRHFDNAANFTDESTHVCSNLFGTRDETKTVVTLSLP